MATVAPCLLCHGSNHRVVRDHVRHNIQRRVLQCTGCDLVYLESPSEDGKGYYAGQDYRERYGPNTKKRLDCQGIFDTYYPFQNDIIRRIEHLLGPEKKVLDLGCSTGHFLAALKGKVGTRVGVELSHEEAQFIRTTLDFPVYTDPIESAQIAEGPFDVITLLQVVEHVEDPVSLLQSAATHLKQDGHIYIELPNIHDPVLEYYQVPGYQEFYYRVPHVYYFSRKTFEHLLGNVGRFEGTVGNVQRYNFLNHLHWIHTNQPQEHFALGNSDPVLVHAEGGDVRVKDELNAFVKRVNTEYISLVEKLFLGESLTFLGKLT